MTIPWGNVNPIYFITAIFVFCVFCYGLDKLTVKFRQGVLVLISLTLIGWFDLYSAIYLLLVSHLAFFTIKYQDKLHRFINKISFAFIIVLMGYKFAQVLEGRVSSGHFILMLGISYYTFRISATLFDAARGQLARVEYINYLHFCVFFPIFIGGPIQRYQNFVRCTNLFSENLLSGLMRILRGIIKKILVADLVFDFIITWLQSQAFQDKVFTLVGTQWGNTANGLLTPSASVLLFGFCCILRAYFDLSALTDVAIGLSRCFGYQVSENFNKPLLAANLIDFWRRWHMTIAAWARDYVFSPCMLTFRNIALAVLATMIFMGLWHQPSLRWIVWGVGHGMGLIVCGIWQRTKLSRWIQSAQMTLLRNSYLVTVPNPLGFAKNSGNAAMASSQPTAETALAQTVIKINLGFVFRPLFRFIFWLPGWLINFLYMSLIFIAVSCPTMTEAVRMYKILFKLGG